MHYRLARKHKNERNAEYNHGDHINEEDDDYNDTSKLVVMITNLKGFPGIKKLVIHCSYQQKLSRCLW